MKSFLHSIIGAIVILIASNNISAETRTILVHNPGILMTFEVLSEEDKTVKITSYEWTLYVTQKRTLNIPVEITDQGTTYSVIGIGGQFKLYAWGVTGGISLERLDIPNGIKYIEDGAFCNKLEMPDLYLPSSLLEIGRSAFSLLSEIPSNNSEGWEYNYDDVESPLIISNYIKTINEDTFNHIRFKTVTLGRNVQTIEQYAFEKIDNLICCATTPPKGYIYLDYLSNVLVPPGCKEIYKNDEKWSKATSIEEYEYYVDAKFEEGNSGKMLKGRALKLNPVITWLHDGSTERYRVWTSSDESVATVSQAGVIVSRNYGSATITLTIEDERGVPYDCIYNVEVTNEAGLSDILDDDTDADSAVEVFTLNGMKVGNSTYNLPAGLYIVKSAKEAKKVYIK